MTTAEDGPVQAMEPWEQHHAVINMPRYTYNAASVLQKGNVGFLVTCTFRREKSATKEALALIRENYRRDLIQLQTTSQSSLQKQRKEFMGVTGASTVVTPTPATSITEEHTPSTVEQVVEVSVKSLPSGGSSRTEVIIGGELPLGDGKSSSEVAEVTTRNLAITDESKKDITDTIENGGEAKDLIKSEDVVEDNHTSGYQEFMLVKLATMGVIFISATRESPRSVLSIVSRMIKDVQARSRPTPLWCHRMLPVQGTCSTNREEVQALVSRLVKDYLDNTSSAVDEPISYAVAFNKRGADVKSDRSQTDGNTEEATFDRGECIKIVTAAVHQVTSNVKVDLTSPREATFDRGECIKIVTAAVHQVTSNVKVDLTSPRMVIVVELVPVAGTRSSLICAVSVLPGDLVITKPKLTVKPLAALAPQAKKRKHH